MTSASATGSSACWRWSWLAALVAGAALAAEPEFDAGAALAFSQAAIGHQIDDLALRDSHGQRLRWNDMLGKPLLVSMVFSGCAYACSTTTRHLDRLVQQARAALGESSFGVATIGFDLNNDTPEAMRAFAARYQIRDPHWWFLAGDDAAAMAQLLDQLGVQVQPTARGFDHTVQLSVIDRDGRLYRQVYGEVFDPPALIEPLKDLVLGRPAAEATVWQRLESRIRLFCTVYDPASGRYYFDYSLFVGIAIGLLVLGAAGLFVLQEARRSQRPA